MDATLALYVQELCEPTVDLFDRMRNAPKLGRSLLTQFETASAAGRPVIKFSGVLTVAPGITQVANGANIAIATARVDSSRIGIVGCLGERGDHD